MEPKKLILPTKASDYDLDPAADHTAQVSEKTKAITEFGHANCADEFKMFILGNKHVNKIIPVGEREWIGLNVLDRDDKLTEFMKRARSK